MKNQNKNNTVVVSAAAKIPKDSTIKPTLASFLIEAEIDLRNSKIIELSFVCPDNNCPGRKYIKNALLGYELNEGINNVIKLMETKLSCEIKTSIIMAALRNLSENFQKIRKANKNKNDRKNR